MQINNTNQQTNFTSIYARIGKNPDFWQEVVEKHGMLSASIEEVKSSFSTEKEKEGLLLISGFFLRNIAKDGGWRRRGGLLKLPVVLTGEHAQAYRQAKSEGTILEFFNALFNFNSGIKFGDLDVGTLTERDIV